jgi:hypothetical protein
VQGFVQGSESVLILEDFVMTDSPVVVLYSNSTTGPSVHSNLDCPSYNRILLRSTAVSFDEPHCKTVPLSILLVAGTVSY